MKNNFLKSSYPIYFVLPALIVFCIFYLGSSVLSFVLSMTDWHITRSEISFVGFENFISLFEEDGFFASLKNTFLFCIIATFFKTTFGIIIALALNRSFKGRDFFRALYYMPCILSSLVVGYIFSFIFRLDGLFNSVLKVIGLEAITKDWLGEYGTALFSVSAVEIWMWSGFCAAIILAGLQSIPEELIEAATIDGADVFNIFWEIKVPFIMPALNVVTLLNIIGGFKVFDIIMSTTNGGPGTATEVFSTFIFKAQGKGMLGYASAVGLVQFILITIVTLVINQAMRRKEIEL